MIELLLLLPLSEAEGEGPGAGPYLIGLGTLALLLFAVFALAAFGKGRDHS